MIGTLVWVVLLAVASSLLVSAVILVRTGPGSAAMRRRNRETLAAWERREAGR
jgi:hypothetical protein